MRTFPADKIPCQRQNDQVSRIYCPFRDPVRVVHERRNGCSRTLPGQLSIDLTTLPAGKQRAHFSDKKCDIFLSRRTQLIVMIRKSKINI